jgi:hypothetical protein
MLAQNSPANGGGRRPNQGAITADGADGADGISESSTYPDYPAAGTAFAAERDVDARYPKERLHTTQSPG